ncbi:unnamed protein product [Rangifer tarandus platyrhynchus]|uniref:Uncharacterized protein n=1 Tax=Rangifer tarandus platyrhynchus TaxID=3082113 RepID=A0AC59Z7C4_RANTA
MSRNSTKGLQRQNVVKELHKQTGGLQPFKPLIGNRLAEAEPAVAMWFPTAACSSEFFRSDFDISHNTTMQNQLKPAPQRGPSLGQRRVAGGGTPRDSLLCGGPPPTAVRPVSSQRKTTRRLS